MQQAINLNAKGVEILTQVAYRLLIPSCLYFPPLLRLLALFQCCAATCFILHILNTKNYYDSNILTVLSLF